MSTPVIALVGPTASGKSSLAVQTALELIARGRPAEVVNTDSMVVYRGMDIGTAKPSPAEQAMVRHHLVDTLEITETATVADFQAQARQVILDCQQRGVIPVLVGGSALYTRAVLDEFDFPGTDPVVRKRWQTALDRDGVEALYAELRSQDPAAAAGIEPQNGRRIVRALEVIELTGSFRSQLPQWRYAIDDVHQFGLDLERPVMDARIEERVHRMWADGLVAEVEGLVARGLREGLTASRALGYSQVLAYLAGELSEDEAVERTIIGTRKFSRKQLSWYRRDHRIEWLPALAAGLAVTIADRLEPDSTASLDS